MTDRLIKLLVAVLSIFAWSVAAETLVLEGEAELTAPRFLFDGTNFTSTGGRDIPRASVNDWWVTPAPAAETSAESQANTDGIREQLSKLRDRGLKMTQQYKGVSGIHLIDDGNYTLTHEKTHVYRYHFTGLVNSEDLLDWGEINLGFTEGRSRVRILFARCLTKDDKLHVLDPDEATVSTPSQGAVHFDPNGRALTAAIPGVEVGAVVDYAYEYESYAPEDWRLFFPGYYFQGKLPVWQSTFTVEIPNDLRLYSWTENWHESAQSAREKALAWLPFVTANEYDLQEVVTDGGTYKVYHWKKMNMPPIVEEPRMPPWHEVAPAVHATLLADWDHLNELTGGMQEERMKPTEEVQALAQALTRDASSTDEKVAILYHWVQKNIRYISVKASLSSGWAGHPAAETLDQGYGDCTDKSVLLATMLRSINVDAEPVVVRTNDKGRFVPRYPVLACNHCITEVEIDGRRFYLDPTSQDYRYPAHRTDSHGVIAFNFIDGERHTIPVPPGIEANGKIAVDKMNLHKDGKLLVHSSNKYAGQYEANLRAGWKRVPETLRQQMMQQFLNGIAPGAVLETFNLTEPQDLATQFAMEYKYMLPEYTSTAGPFRLFQFPDRESTFPEVSLRNRRYPIVYTTTYAIHRTAQLVLPKDWLLVELPEPVQIDSSHLRYSEHWEQRNDTLVLVTEFERKSRRIPIADYADYRANALRISELTKKPVFLRIRGAQKTALH